MGFESALKQPRAPGYMPPDGLRRLGSSMSHLTRVSSLATHPPYPVKPNDRIFSSFETLT